MTNQIDHIVEHLFQKKKLDDVSVYELERFIATHPYFAAGHFLLAKKNQIADPNHFEENVTRAALYFHNPLWLQWLLDQDSDAKSTKSEVTELLPDHDSGVQDEEVEVNTASEELGEKIVEEPFENVANENVSHFYSAELIDEEISSPPPVSDIENATYHHETTEHFQQGLASDAPNDTHLKHENDLSSSSDLNEADIDTANDTGQQTKIVDAGTSRQGASLETVDQSDVTSIRENQSHEIESPEQSKISNEQQETHQSNLEEEESRASAANIERTLSAATLIPAKAEPEKTEFTFEPYHTIDYFASQGIKLQQSDLSKDKFGKQLKSFTEWLRSMKRLPQTGTDASIDEATQRSIQHIAEHSFEEKDIVTETMAEVWIKQGNKEKAIDTLNKLSLLNPSKSHYFAAKIEQLKAS